MTRHRGEPVGEPLFGEDWWVADQKLFEESLLRQQDGQPAPRPAARPAGRLRKRKRPAQSGPVQDMLPWFSDEQGAADGEPVRGDGPQALGAMAAGPAGGDREPGAVLHRPGNPAEEKITALAWELAGDDPPGEPYLGEGRLRGRHGTGPSKSSCTR